MSYGGFLLRHPLFWSLLCGFAVGGALAAATRRTRNTRRPERVASRKWAFAWLFLSIAVAAAAAGIIAPPEPAVYHRLAPVVAGIGFALGLLGLRFPKAAGVPVLLILGSMAFLGAWMVRDFVPVRTPVSPARFVVLSVRESGLTLEVARITDGSIGQPVVVSVADSGLRAELELLELPEELFLLGADRFVRYVGPAGGGPADGTPVLDAAVDRGLVRLVKVEPELAHVNVHRTYSLLVEPHGTPRFRRE